MKFSAIIASAFAVVALAQNATTSCPSYTATTAPAYYTNLPSSVKAALPSWSGAPPSDYCSYTSWMINFSSCAVSSASGTVLASGSYTATGSAATGTAATATVSVASYTGTGAPYATFTGAASNNVASYGIAGLAAAAALVMV